MQKKNVFKALALLCVLVLVIGSIPVSAAKLKTITKRINKGFLIEDATTIRLVTKAEGTVVVHSYGTTNNKNLYVKAPNAKVVNYAPVNLISIKACKKFVEKGQDNDIKVIGEALIQVTPNGNVDTINVNTTAPVEIVIGANAEVDDIEINKAGADVDITALEGAAADATVNKQADVTINGEYADVNLTNKADGTEVTVNTQSDIKTEKDIKVTLGANADGTTIEATNDVIAVDVENPANTEYDYLINGEKVNNDGQGQGTGAAITFDTKK